MEQAGWGHSISRGQEARKCQWVAGHMGDAGIHIPATFPGIQHSCLPAERQTEHSNFLPAVGSVLTTRTASPPLLHSIHYFLLISFFKWFERHRTGARRHREVGRERQTKSGELSSIHCFTLSAHNGYNWGRMNLGAWNSIQISSTEGRNSSTWASTASS